MMVFGKVVENELSFLFTTRTIMVQVLTGYSQFSSIYSDYSGEYSRYSFHDLRKNQQCSSVTKIWKKE